MPRPTSTRVEFESLPEFLRSPAVGRIIAEALLSPSNGDDWPDAYRDMVQDAAREVRDFHGLPGPSPRPTPLTPQGKDPMGYGEDREASA